MIDILICDDMPPEIARLEGLLGDSGFDCRAVSFRKSVDALEYMRSGAAVDLCFLDIRMPELDGIELARQLRADGYAGEIVFASVSNEYAAQSYAVGAFSYLLKPLGLQAVRGVLEKLESARGRRDREGIFVKVSKVARHILFREIAHIEVTNHTVHFQLTDGEALELYAVFGEIAERLLADGRFARCHRSYIVNLGEIAAVDERDVTMRGGRRIPYSKSYSDIKKRFARYATGQDGRRADRAQKGAGQNESRAYSDAGGI